MCFLKQVEDEQSAGLAPPSLHSLLEEGCLGRGYVRASAQELRHKLASRCAQGKREVERAFLPKQWLVVGSMGAKVG